MDSSLAKRCLNRLYKDGLDVRGHVYDPVYRPLGYAQATGIALLIPVLLVVLIPLTENARVYFVYQKMDDTVANEYGAKGIGLTILNFAVWLVTSVAVGCVVGKKIGASVWAVKCLASTRCRSSHTMDQALTESNLNKVMHNWHAATEQSFDLIQVMADPQVMHALCQWIQQVCVFFSRKRQRDKRRGKVLSAESWWAAKKRFYNTFDVGVLLNRLTDYQFTLKAHVCQVDSFLQQYHRDILPLVECHEPDVTAVKSECGRWLSDVMAYFEKSVSIRHQKRGMQSIYKDKAYLNKQFTEMLSPSVGRDELATLMHRCCVRVKAVKRRIQQHQVELPIIPQQLESLLSSRRAERYLQLSERQWSRYFDNVKRLQSELPCDERPLFLTRLRRNISHSFLTLSEQPEVIDVSHVELDLEVGTPRSMSRKRLIGRNTI